MYVDDLTRLRHMLDAAREAVEYISSHDRIEMDTNRMLYHSIKDCLTVVGEAAYKVSGDYKDAHPEIAWHNLKRLRHELVHDYFMIDPGIMWNSVVALLPGLIEQLKSIDGIDSRADN